MKISARISCWHVDAVTKGSVNAESRLSLRAEKRSLRPSPLSVDSLGLKKANRPCHCQPPEVIVGKAVDGTKLSAAQCAAGKVTMCRMER